MTPKQIQTILVKNLKVHPDIGPYITSEDIIQASEAISRALEGLKPRYPTEADFKSGLVIHRWIKPKN